MMDPIKIDSHKLDLHPGEVSQWLKADDKWEGVKSIYPIYVEISPFGGCNFRCTFCAKDFLKYKNIKIDLPVLKKCLQTMKKNGVKSVYFAGEGEPTLYPQLDEIFEYCAEIGLDSALNTNCSIENTKILKAAVLNCKWIRASVNAGTAQEHSALHQCREDVFERVFENLKYCVSIRKEFASRCVIGAQVVLLDQNRGSLVELARRCREAGVDYLTVKPYSQHPESVTKKHENTDYQDVQELADSLAKEEREGFRVHFRVNSFHRAETGKRGYQKCYSTSIFWAYLRSNGDVFGCSNFLTDSQFKYGNINEAGFDEIWEGPGRKAGFEYMRDAHDLAKCRLNCRMDKVNEYLWELRHPSSHANFI